MTITNVYRLIDTESQHWFRREFVDESDPLLKDLAQFRLGLLDQGYEPIPCGGKDRLHNRFTSGLITPERVRIETQCGTQKLNTSLRTGLTVGVDNDLRDLLDAAAADQITEHILGPTPLKRYGSKGAMWVYRNQSPIKKLSITAKDGTRLFEVLGQGQQFVAFGHHPAGIDYRWEGDDPTTVRWADLPEVTPEQLRRLHETQFELLKELGYEFKSETPRADKPVSARVYENDNDDDENIPELCRAALSVIPNNFPDRETWRDFSYAMHDAGLDFSDWENWSRQWSKNTTEAIRKTWNSTGNPRSITFRTILGKADEIDPDWRKRYYGPINQARRDAFIEDQYQSYQDDMAREEAKSRVEPDEDDISANDNTGFPKPERAKKDWEKAIWRACDDEQDIPPRQWLLGNAFCRGFVSSLFAGGGTGKTALRMAQAVAMVSGKQITGEHVFQTCRLLYVSLEDDEVETRRRLRACRLHHGISKEEVENLFIYNLNGGAKFAHVDAKGNFKRGQLEDKLIEIITSLKIDVVILDPFKKTHGVEENDNNLIDMVVDILTGLASYFSIAVDVPHHIAKGMVEAGNADNGRGASALKDGVRLAYTLTRMTKEDAKEYQIHEDNRWSYVRVDSAKVNITAGGNCQWFRLVGVKLNNGNTIYPNGDDVQTVETWKPVSFEALVESDPTTIQDILDTIANADPPYGKNYQHKNYVGKAFGLHVPGITNKAVNNLVFSWMKSGRVKIVAMQTDPNDKNKTAEIVQIG